MKDERNQLGHKATCRNGSTPAPSKKHVAPIKETQKYRIAESKAAPTIFSCLAVTENMKDGNASSTKGFVPQGST